MLEVLLLILFVVFWVPIPLCIVAYVAARGWRIRGAPMGAPSLVFAQRLGLIGLAVCGAATVASFGVPVASVGDAAGNTAVIALMALGCTGAALGAAALGQRRAMWAGVIAILVGAVGWLFGGVVLFMANVGAGMPGRPLRVRGTPVLPRVRRGARRSDDDTGDVSIAGLTTDTRRALAQAWEDDARYEAASVAAFEHLARDLAAARAPDFLIAWAMKAANEEVGHAELCFALASAYAARAVTASPLPFAPAWTRRPESRSAQRERLAIDSLIDGCVGEGAAALGAALGAERATDPAVRRILERIAREEETHAELAWAILAWVLDEEPGLVSVLASRLEQVARRSEDAPETRPHDLACQGRISGAERTRHLGMASERARERIALYSGPPLSRLTPPSARLLEPLRAPRSPSTGTHASR